MRGHGPPGHTCNFSAELDFRSDCLDFTFNSRFRVEFLKYITCIGNHYHRKGHLHT